MPGRRLYRYNLGENEMEQQTPLHPPPPPPQINDEAVQKLKRSIFPSLISGEGRGDNFPIYFVQEV